MKIPEYKDLAEKKKAFGKHYQQIASVNELKKFLDTTESYSKYTFRGICEAKYKNFTSAQRKYIINDLTSINFNDLIQKQIDTVKEENNKLLEKYYKCFDIEPNDFLYLGIAQHYGGISPLLDFTTAFKTALFFMTDGASFPIQRDNDIGNYSSLYYISKDEFDDFNDFLIRVTEKVSSKIDEFAGDNKLFLQKGINIITSLTKFENFRDIGKDISLLIPNKRETHRIPVKGETKRLRGVFSITNLNIVAQKGCFVFYLPVNPTTPFEKPLHCIDIHKSLLPYIIEYTELKKSDIYPDEYELVKDSCNKALRNILN